MKRYFVIAAAFTAFTFTQCGQRDSANNSTSENMSTTENSPYGTSADSTGGTMSGDAGGSGNSSEMGGSDGTSGSTGGTGTGTGNSGTEGATSSGAGSGTSSTEGIEGVPGETKGQVNEGPGGTGNPTGNGNDLNRQDQNGRTASQKASDKVNRAADVTSRTIDSAGKGGKR